MAPNHFIKISEVGVLAWGSRIWIGMSGAGLHESDFSNASWVGIVWSWIPIFGLWDLISDFRFRTSQRFGLQDVDLELLMLNSGHGRHNVDLDYRA